MSRNTFSVSRGVLNETQRTALDLHSTGLLDDRTLLALDSQIRPARAAVEALSPERVATLGAMLEAFIEARDVKASTVTRLTQTHEALIRHFGADRPAASITEHDAEVWKKWLRTKGGKRGGGYSAATVSKSIKNARQAFRWAVKRGFAHVNPFAEVKAGSEVNTARAFFVTREMIAKVMKAAPCDDWRGIIALARFGGLRCSSEVLSLLWSDVDWEGSRLTIRSSKTEGHEGHGTRMIPLFPEVREALEALWRDPYRDREGRVIERYEPGRNLATMFAAIVARAGVRVWPRLFHNLRASRQTELASNYPLHTVCAWIGNGKLVAAGHYLQVTDADFTRAVKRPLSGGSNRSSQAHSSSLSETLPTGSMGGGRS